ncbi:MAG: arginine--tRNA ligase [Candidatus Methylomirabilales bacterium]
MREVRAHLDEAIRAAGVRLAHAAKVSAPAEIPWSVPAQTTFGDLSTPLALSFSKALGRRPREVAEEILRALTLDPLLVARVEVAGAGYLNFFVAPGYWRQVIRVAREEGPAFGRSRAGGGRLVQVEFVSANPTGPLHVAHGRGAAVGDAVARLLEATGWHVEREYYINDAGAQVAVLGASVWARYQELTGRSAPFPADGYQGAYVRHLAEALLAKEGKRLLALPEGEAASLCAAFGREEVLGWIQRDLAAFGVTFDRWFSERSLLERGEVRATLDFLRGRGHLYEGEGALWFRSSALGDDKDRVLVKSSGEMTYAASDIAYHWDKLRRGFTRLIDVWGADHHGYVSRMRAAVAALGHDPGSLTVLLVQIVRLLRGGLEVRMSKRTGDFISLQEVLEEVGPDACRYIFLTRRADSHLDFDLEVAKAQSMENPVYYVQYAHARCASILREAEKAGVPLPASEAPMDRLALPEEIALLKQLALFPEVVEAAAAALEPHRLPVYLQGLAAEFHAYYTRHRVLSEDRELSGARLSLVAALKQVIANALALLGVGAPDRM